MKSKCTHYAPFAIIYFSCINYDRTPKHYLSPSVLQQKPYLSLPQVLFLLEDPGDPLAQRVLAGRGDLGSRSRRDLQGTQGDRPSQAALDSLERRSSLAVPGPLVCRDHRQDLGGRWVPPRLWGLGDLQCLACLGFHALPRWGKCHT
jgi:hypothetical protein